MINILAISGSLRAQSYNTALIRAAQALTGTGVAVELATLHGIPLYDGDLEQGEGLPQAVIELKHRIIACDGLLLATPEYNNGVPGVFKNAIDWLSRPPTDQPRVFHHRPVAVMGATMGGFGTILAQNDWLPILRLLMMRYWSGGRLLVSKAHEVFDAGGNLLDDGVRSELRAFVAGFAQFVDQANTSRR